MPSFWEKISVDGQEMDVYTSAPSGSGPFPAVIVSQHGGGVDKFIQTMCDRFAEAGFAGSTIAFVDYTNELAYFRDEVLPRLPPRSLRRRVVLHPVCSVHKMNLAGKLLRVAEACASVAEVPVSAGCCGFAGDRGFWHPELTLSAMQAEAVEVAAGAYAGYYSSSRTCEVGLARATGRPYRHIWNLLDEATRGDRVSVDSAVGQART
jgi:Fe-S oxidoreductase